jgi:hypothetical protein
MDGTELFQNVLAPGERLLWTGERPKAKRDALVGLIAPVIIGVALVRMFLKISSFWHGPLPLYIRLELGVIALFLLLPFVIAWWQFKKAKDTAYAVTDRRLMVAEGPDRDKIRELPLKSLQFVRVMNTRRGRRLSFGLRADSGNAKWAASGWETGGSGCTSKDRRGGDGTVFGGTERMT